MTMSCSEGMSVKVASSAAFVTAAFVTAAFVTATS